MSLHVSKKAAHIEASRLEMTTHKNGKSSGWGRIQFGVRRKFRWLWEVYEK